MNGSVLCQETPLTSFGPKLLDLKSILEALVLCVLLYVVCFTAGQFVDPQGVHRRLFRGRRRAVPWKTRFAAAQRAHNTVSIAWLYMVQVYLHIYVVSKITGCAVCHSLWTHLAQAGIMTQFLECTDQFLLFFVQPRNSEQQEKRVHRLLTRERKKRKKLKEFGIDYDFPG